MEYTVEFYQSYINATKIECGPISAQGRTETLGETVKNNNQMTQTTDHFCMQL